MYSLKNSLSWLEISASALIHNLRCYKSLLSSDIKISVVVKSNAYGHGIDLIAPFCDKLSDIDYLCTSSASEALHIRSLGVKKPIIVLYFIDIDYKLLIEHNLEVVVFDKKTLDDLNALAIKYKAKVAIHIKIDTGMSRFGFEPNQIITFVEYAIGLSGIFVKGISTHFAESENENRDFTIQQRNVFIDIVAKLEKQGIDIPLKHAANSAAVTSSRDNHFNLVRIGAGFYGTVSRKVIERDINNAFKLRHALSWKTRISHIRVIPENTPVGYDRTYTTNRRTVIALLPIGYFEGYDRRCGNLTSVLITPSNSERSENCYAQVIGRVCMNVLIIDVTGIVGLAVGDEVILIGDYDTIRAAEIAQVVGSSNPREITTRLSAELPRFCVDD